MRYRAALKAQRTRRTLNQQAMQRSHRRCDLIRLGTDEDTAADAPLHDRSAEQPQDAAVNHLPLP